MDRRIKEAHLLSFILEEEKVVAIRAIKKPLFPYIARIIHDAHISPLLLPFFTHEIGWSVTLPEYRNRGYSSMLLELLLSHYKGPAFTTNRINNIAARRILEKFGFKQIGQKFHGLQEPIVINFRPGGSHAHHH
jgi:RimJ/RimL family protein N-acetyltransferase